MDKREAMRKAHQIVSLCIKQHRDNAVEGFADNPADSDKIESALEELEMRHWRDSQPSGTTGSSPRKDG